MELKNWLELERGRGTALAKAIGVPQSFVSKMASGGKQVPFEQCMPIERFTEGEVTRADLKPDDYMTHWPELAQAQAERAPAASDLIAVVTTAIEAVLHRAEDRIDELKTDAKVELKLTSVEVRGEIEKDAHNAIERLAAPKKWDGTNRRADVDAAAPDPAAAAVWNGKERRNGVERRHPEVLEAPISLAVKA